jgi:hypothetical protein
MIRQHMLNLLCHDYGPPLSDRVSEYWIVGGNRLEAVHICLNERTAADEAHILIFDPRGTQADGHSVTEAHVTTIREANALCARIRQIVQGPQSEQPPARLERPPTACTLDEGSFPLEG